MQKTAYNKETALRGSAAGTVAARISGCVGYSTLIGSNSACMETEFSFIEKNQKAAVVVI